MRSAAFPATSRRRRRRESTTTGPATTAIASHKLDDLEGKTYQEARATLSGYQLGLIIPKAQPVRDATHAANIVVASVPDTGAVLHRGDTVRLKVSRGQMSIPNIVGATQADAQAKLGPNFRFSPMSESSDTIDRGSVTRTDPAVGTTVPVGSSVTVYISTGPATVEVPKLVGRSESDARATLAGAGPDRPRAPGKPLLGRRQYGPGRQAVPEPGTPVVKGRAVGFDLANSPCTVFVPTVVGMTLDEAIARLQRETINPNSIRTTPQPVTDPNDDGRVLDQDIRGSNTKPFIVTLTVGQFSQTDTTTTTRHDPARPHRGRGRRSLVRARDLAGFRALGDRGARSRAL